MNIDSLSLMCLFSGEYRILLPLITQQPQLIMHNFLKTLSLLLLVAKFASASPIDSVGVETKGGKRIVLHRVEQGQTLFAIGRRYNIAPEVIKQANNGLTDVRYDEIIRVPVADLPVKTSVKPAKTTAPVSKSIANASSTTATAKPISAKKQAREDAETAKRIEKEVKTAGLHVVEAGQTLYSLSVRYSVLMADLRQWNGLSTDNLQAGQTLIVSEQAYKKQQTTTQPVAPASVTPAKPTPTPSVKPEPAKPTTEPAKPAAEPAKTTPPRPTEPKTSAQTELAKPTEDSGTADAIRPTTGRRIAETGLADVIDPADTSPKLLALHRSAPVGSLIQVKNDSSNQTLWVKVIGRLPDTGLNDRVIVKLSARAFAKLSPNTQRFRAEVSYLVP
jgi:LysM repeat protein